MTTPHKHAALIKAWADGAVIQFKDKNLVWIDRGEPGYGNAPSWYENDEYRIKPDPLKLAITALTKIIDDDCYSITSIRAIARKALEELT